MFNSTIVSYKERGEYGNNKYRGNCSGRLIEDIITTPFYHFFDKNGKPIHGLSDYMVGGGTTKDVCEKYGLKGTWTDLRLGYDMMTMDIPDHPDNIFWHPPYAGMIIYSDVMYSANEIINKYGYDPRINDLSRAFNWDDFVNKMNYCALKQFTALRKGGRLFILVGDWKQKGVLYSMFADMVKLGILEQVIIKAEHNCWSDNQNYANKNYVPIQHEYLVVLRKDSAIIIPVTVPRNYTFDVRNSKTSTWLTILLSVLEEYGPLHLKKIYSLVKDSYPSKCENNQNVDAKIRQTIYRYYQYFKNCGNGIYCAA